MGTSDGIFTARTCLRMPSDGQWKLDAVKAVREFLGTWELFGSLGGRVTHEFKSHRHYRAVVTRGANPLSAA